MVHQENCSYQCISKFFCHNHPEKSQYHFHLTHEETEALNNKLQSPNLDDSVL